MYSRQRRFSRKDAALVVDFSLGRYARMQAQHAFPAVRVGHPTAAHTLWHLSNKRHRQVDTRHPSPLQSSPGMGVSKIQIGQLWKKDGTRYIYLVTRLYTETISL